MGRNAVKMMLTALEAAEWTGLGTVTKFRRAVSRGEMPPPHTETRPQLWSRHAIEAALTPKTNDDNIDPRITAYEKRWGMR